MGAGTGFPHPEAPALVQRGPQHVGGRRVKFRSKCGARGQGQGSEAEEKHARWVCKQLGLSTCMARCTGGSHLNCHTTPVPSDRFVKRGCELSG